MILSGYYVLVCFTYFITFFLLLAIGYATKDEGFYSHEGQDYGVKKFYWIVLDFDTHLEVSKGGEPPLNRLMIKDSPFYLICGKHENHGIIPGYFNEKKEAVYAYGGKEFKAKEFLWVVADNQGKNFILFCFQLN